MNKFRLLVCRFPGNQQEHPDSSGWVMRYMHTWHQDPHISELLGFKLADTPITMSRNRAVKHALAVEADYLLMIDSDMSPDLERDTHPLARPFWESSWEFLLSKRDEFPAAVGAPYCGPPPWENIYVFRWAARQSDHPNEGDFKLDQFGREEAAMLGGIQEVAALPTGLILYDTRIFQRQDLPWFEYEWTDAFRTHKATTEDVYQTRNASMAWHLTGGERGGRMYCNWDAWAGHVKLKTVGKPQLIGMEQVGTEFQRAVRRDWKLLDRRAAEPVPHLNGKAHAAANA